MKRALLMSSCIAALLVTGACGRRDTSSAAPITALTVTGCLSAAGDRFMLTALDKDSSTTTVYQLMNADDQLRSLVGKQVRVSGDAQPVQSAESREVTPPAAPAATSGRTDSDAKVSTVTDTKLDVHKLSVNSAAATGDACPQ